MSEPLEHTDAAVLAGGLGLRLREAVSGLPKVLAEVNGKPFLAYILDKVAAAGVKRVILCTGYLGEMVREAFGEEYRRMKLLYSQEPEPLGTAGALRYALPLLESETVLAMNGDSLCEADLKQFYHWHSAKKTGASLLLIRQSNTRRYGSVITDNEDRITAFKEKADSGASGWISAGIYLIKRELLETIPEGRPVSIERETFPSWVGGDFCGLKSEGKFIDIGAPEDYRAAAGNPALEPVK